MIDCGLTFADVAMIDGEMYFSSKEINGIFHLNQKFQAEYITKDNGEPDWNELTHRMVISDHKCLYFIPFISGHILVYNVESNKKRMIDIAERMDAEEPQGYAYAVAWDDGYMLFPFYLHNGIDYFRPVDENIKKFPEVNEQIFSQMDEKDYRTAMINAFSVSENEDFVYVMTMAPSILFRIHKEDARVELCFSAKEGLCNILCDEEKVWITSLEKNEIICWDSETKKDKRYVVPNSGVEVNNTLLFLAHWGDSFLLASQDENLLFIYNKEKDRLEQWEMVKEIYKSGFRVENSNSPFFSYKYASNELWLFPFGGNGIVKINENSGEIKFIKIERSKDLSDRMKKSEEKHLVDIIGRNIDSNKIMLEGETAHTSFDGLRKVKFGLKEYLQILSAERS